MATASSPEASEIRRRGRRRLLGAITLVMVLVVFVPMILDNEPRPSRSEPSTVIPPKDNVPPLPAPSVAASSSRVQQAAASSSRAPQGGNGPGPNVSPQAAAASPKAPISASGEVPEPPKAAAPKLEGFAVQVGAFRDEDRLKQAKANIEAAGISHYTERIEGGGGPITRLRAGPFPTREAADAARAKLQQGQVVALP